MTLPKRAKGGGALAAGGSMASMTPAVRHGNDFTTLPRASITALMPVGVARSLDGRVDKVAHGSITNANNANVSLDSLRVLFNNGHAYANVHTAAHPGGEIRDQVHPSN